MEDAEFAGGVEARLQKLIDDSVELDPLQKLIDDSVELDPESDYWKRERAQRAVVATLWPGTFYS
ncbi:MAG: hypothetical protein JRE73_09150 [Deltaproteobacteria bacterium]|nr:hypothetical protein [Deltaproteobacteria bacterium]